MKKFNSDEILDQLEEASLEFGQIVDDLMHYRHTGTEDDKQAIDLQLEYLAQYLHNLPVLSEYMVHECTAESSNQVD